MYFDVDTPNGASRDFQKHGYQFIEDKTYTLIHYLGDEGAAVDFCHKNCKHATHQAFTRTCPSQMKKLKELCSVEKANVVYKREVASLDCDPNAVPVHAPRNMKQLRNARYGQLQQLRLTRDDLYNLHEISYDIPGFVHKIVLYTGINVVCFPTEASAHMCLASLL